MREKLASLVTDVSCYAKVKLKGRKVLSFTNVKFPKETSHREVETGQVQPAMHLSRPTHLRPADGWLQ